MQLQRREEKFHGLQHRPFRKKSPVITDPIQVLAPFGIAWAFGASGADVVRNSLLDPEETHAIAKDSRTETVVDGTLIFQADMSEID